MPGLARLVAAQPKAVIGSLNWVFNKHNLPASGPDLNSCAPGENGLGILLLAILIYDVGDHGTGVVAAQRGFIA